MLLSAFFAFKNIWLNVNSDAFFVCGNIWLNVSFALDVLYYIF